MGTRVAAVVTAVVLAGAGGAAQAPAPAAWTVAYVDVEPASREAALAALGAYRDAARGEAGAAGVELFEQVGWPGRFLVLEGWASEAAATAHAGAPSVAAREAALAAVRVSGYDERPYVPLSVAPAVPGGPDARHVVAHVDIGPGGQQVDAPALLTRLAEATRTEAGALRFDVLRHRERGNHFTVVGSWTGQAALDAHVGAPYTRAYRDAVQPVTGSPLDERLYAGVP